MIRTSSREGGLGPRERKSPVGFPWGLEMFLLMGPSERDACHRSVADHVADQAGLTLIELMMAMAIAGIFISAMVLSFGKLMQGTMVTRQRTVASNLAQARLEELKDYAYHRLIPTTAAALITATDSTNPYLPETIPVQGVTFTRYTRIQKARVSGTSLTMLAPDANDEGLKSIVVSVTWMEKNDTRTVSLSSLLEDPNRSPLDSIIYGTVTAVGGAAVPNINVFVVSNPNWEATTNAAGQYTLQVANGTYQVTVTNDAYVTQTSGNLVLASNTLVNNFTNYTLKQTGQVSGYVFIRPNLVIAKVVTKMTSDSDHEYMEVYNPTSSTLTMNISMIKLTEYDGSNNPTELFPTYVTTSIQPYGYYLFANSSIITVYGTPYTADAYWASSSALHTSKGGIVLANNLGQTYDKLAWAPSGQAAPDTPKEGTGFDLAPDANLTDKCLERRSYPGATPPDTDGNAYDSQSNSADFVKHGDLTPRYSGSPPRTPTGGTIINETALVFADDGLSSTVALSSTGWYQDTNIASGTWNLVVMGGPSLTQLTYTIALSGLVITQNASVSQNLVMTGGSAYGAIVGHITTGGSTNLNNILVRAGTTQTRTNANGSYFLALVDGTYNVIANYNYDSNTYSQDTYNATITLTAGGVWDDTNFDLSGAGGISGKVTINGTDALPNVRVVAKDSLSAERGSALSNSSGNYTISGLPTSGNNYTVEPQLDPKETSSPTSVAVTVASGSTSSDKNFQISNALCTITGAVKKSTGETISQGVVIIATTATIAGDPPTINSTVRGAATVYYSVTSDSEGFYSVKVRGAVSPGTSYNVYAWYTDTAGTTTKKTSTTTAIAGGTNTVNFIAF